MRGSNFRVFPWILAIVAAVASKIAGIAPAAAPRNRGAIA
jgi:hypothetical protein